MTAMKFNPTWTDQVLFQISAVTVESLTVYKDSVCKTCDAMDANIKVICFFFYKYLLFYFYLFYFPESECLHFSFLLSVCLSNLQSLFAFDVAILALFNEKDEAL